MGACLSTQSSEIGKLAEALAKAQGEITGAVKDSQNPFFKSNYADLASVWDACRGPLSKYGLSVIQTTESNIEAGICVITLLAHSSGQWVRGVLPILALKKDPQGVGSAITYARRYALAAIAGIAQVDDDAQSAQGRRVAPEAPGDDDGHPKDMGYRIPFGKFAKRALEEIDILELGDYVNYIEKKAEKDGKPLSGPVKEFVERAVAHIVAFENRASA